MYMGWKTCMFGKRSVYETRNVRVFSNTYVSLLMSIFEKRNVYEKRETSTARSREDETPNGHRNANRNPEWWGDFSQLQIQIKPNSQFEFVLQDTEVFKLNQNLNSHLYCEIPRNLSVSISTNWLKSPNHSGFRCWFRRAFRVSSVMERALCEKRNI